MEVLKKGFRKKPSFCLKSVSQMENLKLAPTSQYGGPYSRIEDYGLEVSITPDLTCEGHEMA